MPDHPSPRPPLPALQSAPARLGQELLRVHGQLRVRVGALESVLESDSADTAAFATSCLSFCRALRRHHVGEDAGTFAVLRRHAPGLGDVLDALARDHAFLDPLLDRLEQLVADGRAVGEGVQEASAQVKDAEVERELAGIAAVLENHLSYEERVLVTVLDHLEVASGSPDDVALRAPLDVFDPPPHAR